MYYLDNFPPELKNFILVTVFSLLIGLSQRRLHMIKDKTRLFGTDRTFTFIGILGFILYIIDNQTYIPFMGGGLVLAVFLGIFYFSKIRDLHDYGLTTIIIALITYCLAPLLMTQPLWLVLLIIVTLLVFAELKESLMTLTTKFDKEEFITLGKFLFIAGVVLPIVPDTPLIQGISITPYKVWLAVVVISTISYLSYLLHKFVFRNSGILLSGIFGGLYSSTATTIILSRKAKESQEPISHYAAGIILSVSMMYLRILIVVFIFNKALFLMMAWSMLALFLLTALSGLAFLYPMREKLSSGFPDQIHTHKNPLEFKVALLFAILYLFFTILTHYTISHYGRGGLTVLSFFTGVTDIDPFLISLFQGKFSMPLNVVATASFYAMISNNIVKLGYSISFAPKILWKKLIPVMGIIIAATLVAALIIN